MSKLKHALRNKKLSEKLYSEGVFLDWANTTAFYSALHFIHHKLLPGKYNGVLCESIEDVFKALNCKGKHEATCQLTQVGLPTIAVEYSFLMNCSFTARYIDYNVHPQHAKLCQKYLTLIEKVTSKE
ncbi:hypothetical protein ACYSNM_10625 [Myroides sp. LJL116]